ncbi:MAG: NAD(P)/FAD-dependent oxidoreductase [Calditrichaeota bacterium]|nr:MAG: NAD(P)/FAD-dependent oxidoreductase [Calditrichota bacterium]
MRQHYDCIVVGGGPGGAWAARHAAEGGARVVLLEKDREVGVPVRCAEAVGEKGLKEVVEPDPRWISNVIEGLVLVAPNGREVLVEGQSDRGLMLDRKIFDYDLVRMAAENGAEVYTKAYVFDLIKPNGRVEGVRVQHLGKTYDIRGDVVIGADGVESRVGRWAGLRTNVKLRDLESCIQMTLSNIKLDPKYVYFYFGRDVAPGGYLWVFPKSDRLANVGLGISGEFAKYKSAQHYLKKFIDRHFPHAAVLYTVVGGVPCAPTLKKIVADGLMLVGDAAHQVNPVSGGGITTAMIAGRLAGRVAARAVQEDDFSEKRLAEYARKWQAAEGKNHERFYKIKKAIYKLTDEDLNRTADAILRLPVEKRTIVNIFKSALINHPSLIFEVMRLFVRA